MMNEVFWISHPDAVCDDEKLFRFRKTMPVWDAYDRATVDISAEARYKLYINGRLAAVGPCKGSGVKKYYDTIDVAEYLIRGDNEFVVEVLQLAAAPSMVKGKSLPAVLRTGNMALALSFELYRGQELCYRQVTKGDNGWTVAEVTGVSMRGYNDAVMVERHNGPEKNKEVYVPAVQRWNVDSDDKEYYPWGGFNMLYLYPRPIPMMYQKPVALKRNGSLIECDYLTFGIPTFRFTGTGKITLRYAECYGEYNTKGDRENSELGLFGYEDEITCDGEVVFEPFWFRCFRYIRMTFEGEVALADLSFLEMSYPFVFRQDYDFGTERDNKLWEISARTLMRCTHETYEDCPYYEQLQYGMDTSLQMIFNYQFTDDDRLARKAMDDFRNCQRPDGIMVSRYPSVYDQYIPTFSFFFIFMVYAHYQRFGDLKLVRENLRAVDGVLEWFENFKDEKTGLIQRSKFWNFIDWAEPWDHQWVGGIPFTADGGIITIHSAMMCYCLKIGAELYDACGRHCTAVEYRNRAKALADKINELCYDEAKGLYADDMDHVNYSQHMQTWCVLAGIAEGDRARAIMENSVDLDAKSTFAFAYFYFRALEEVGMYDLSDKLMDNYRNLIDLNCTTIPETPVGARSDCHAWGAVALYEFSAVILGVRTVSAKDKTVEVRPYIENRPYAKGTVSSIAGDVAVAWRKEGDTFYLSAKAADATKVRVVMPDGTAYESAGDGKEYACKIG